MIVRAYNAEATLQETLQSVTASTYSNIEIIVVDDGSTDSTSLIAGAFADHDSRVRICHRNNGGPSAALNTGLDQARGDYVATLDSDDVWHPTKLQAQLSFAQSNPEVGYIYTFVRYIDAQSRILRDAPPQRFPRHALCRGIYESLIGVGSSALLKRATVGETGGCDETLGGYEDLLLQLAITSRHPIGFVPQYLIGYRVRPGSVSSSATSMLENWREVRGRIRAVHPDVPEMVHRWAHARRCMEFAEKFAWQRSYATSSRIISEALASDPERVLRLLGYRLLRHLRKRGRSVPPLAVGSSFSSCDPRQAVRLDPFDACEEGRLLRSLDEQRTRRLFNIDRTLIPASGRVRT